MPSNSNKKLIIIYVLKILQEYSDNDHPMTYQDIIEKIYRNYDMEVERKSVANNIQSLIEIGYDIKNIVQKGWYLDKRLFKLSQATYLIDSILTSEGISADMAGELINIITSTLSENQRKDYNKYLFRSKGIKRTSNEDIFSLIEIISHAIKTHKKITFQYVMHDRNKKIVSKRNGEIYIASPYAMVCNKGKYYLVCENEHHKGEISNLRMDKMRNIGVSEEYMTPIQRMKDYSDGFDIVQYINENPYMYGNKMVRAEIKLLTEDIVDTILDTFGDVPFDNSGEETIAKVYAPEETVISFVFQYYKFVELISPTVTKEKVINEITNMSNRYKK